MRSSLLSLLALGAATTSAFRDTSPFFLASTSEILSAPAQLKSATHLLNDLSTALSTCPSDYYVIASQPGVHNIDFVTGKSAPRLGAKMTGEDETIRSTMAVNEVAGVLEAKQIQKFLETECGAETTIIDASAGSYSTDFSKEPRVVVIDFPSIAPDTERDQQLSDHDGLLSDIVSRLPSKKYTILYTTTPREWEKSDSPTYKSPSDPYQDPIRVDLKRDYSAPSRRDQTTNNSLFDEYQYFTPGLFMGLIAAFFFILILYIGLSALMSLQVSYAAFEKDTSSTVQKKQQ
ncbi:Ac45/VOA1 transmembrane domain-containing protein [Aspergillus undulatus]|uniref:Ac45/VOA1 transmembrane domain-containing protein n=1 Tax=Aspergillus undulatus TaxID=1810928 RepID=UPI003CCE4D67